MIKRNFTLKALIILILNFCSIFSVYANNSDQPVLSLDSNNTVLTEQKLQHLEQTRTTALSIYSDLKQSLNNNSLVNEKENKFFNLFFSLIKIYMENYFSDSDNSEVNNLMKTQLRVLAQMFVELNTDNQANSNDILLISQSLKLAIDRTQNSEAILAYFQLLDKYFNSFEEVLNELLLSKKMNTDNTPTENKKIIFQYSFSKALSSGVLYALYGLALAIATDYLPFMNHFVETLFEAGKLSVKFPEVKILKYLYSMELFFVAGYLFSSLVQTKEFLTNYMESHIEKYYKKVKTDVIFIWQNTKTLNKIKTSTLQCHQLFKI